MSDLNLKGIWIPYELLTNNNNTCPSNIPYPSPAKVLYPMEQKVKDNKYNINNKFATKNVP